MPKFSGRLSRTRALTLMKKMGIRPVLLSGDSRRRHSNAPLRTMETLNDPVDYFIKALNTELEHGAVNSGTNVTGDDLEATVKIVAAHLFGVEHGERPLKWKWFGGYYDYLWDMEKKGPR